MTELRSKNIYSAFGEQSVVQNTPIVQEKAVYGISHRIRTENVLGGTTTAVDGEYKISINTTANSGGVVLSNRHIVYKAGQGASCLLTARFNEGVEDSQQRAGFQTTTDRLIFGYVNTVFGIQHAYGGALEIQELQITTPASGGENATVTIDGDAYTVPLTSGTVQHNAAEIADSLTTQIPLLWISRQNDDKVVIKAIRTNEGGGAFTFSSATAAGTFTQIAAMASLTEDFIPQTSWNQNTASWLDPQKGNVYKIQMQYLGYGAINFFVEEPESGRFVLVHRIKYANSNTQPSVRDPSFQVGWALFSRGSTIAMDLYGSSMAGFIEGKMNEAGFAPHAVDNIKSGVGATLTNIVSIRVRSEFNSITNLGDVLPQKVFVATDTTKSAIVEVFVNGTVAGEQNWQYENEEYSVIEIDTAGTTVTNGNSTVVASRVLGGGESGLIDLTGLNIVLRDGDVLTIAAAKTTGSNIEVAASIEWLEDL